MNEALIFGQDEREFDALLSLLRPCRAVLEIGCRYGETSWRMGLAMPTGARLVCVDLGKNSYIEEDFLAEARKRLASLQDRDTHLLVGNSHDPLIQAQVKALGPYDCIFIDGDHSYAGVLEDWLRYGHMAPMVAFHDILREKDYGPWKLWQELRTQHPHVEFGYSGGGRNLGIGVLWHEVSR